MGPAAAWHFHAKLWGLASDVSVQFQAARGTTMAPFQPVSAPPGRLALCVVRFLSARKLFHYSVLLLSRDWSVHRTFLTIRITYQTISVVHSINVDRQARDAWQSFHCNTKMLTPQHSRHLQQRDSQAFWDIAQRQGCALMWFQDSAGLLTSVPGFWLSGRSALR